MSDKIFTIHGFGNAIAFRAKDKRARARSAHQLTPYYIYQGETVQIRLEGEHLGHVEAAIGLPELNTRHYYKLKQGINSFTADGDGLLSFLNKNDYGQVQVEILSSPQEVPYFKLNKTTEEAWKKELANSNAPWVILSSELADVVVKPQSARNNVTSATALMENFDLFLQAQDDTTGVVKDGKADFKADPNRNLHIESSRSYMFAAKEYTGYMGAAAMQRLLRTDNRWGIWHENGHQRQQEPWQWNAGNGMTETTVNIFSLMSQEKMNGQITALNSYYPTIKEFLASDVKNFDIQDHTVKLGMFWQLRQAFGEGFFPQLMQRYRLMNSTPAVSQADAQKNLLIRTVSEVVNINMEPFFKKWGIPGNAETVKYLERFPVLEKPIWENIGDSYHTLDMPEKEYIPELIYLKKSISEVSLSHSQAKFTIDKAWCTPYRYIFKKDGAFLAEIVNGKAYNCSVDLNEKGCHVSFIFDNSDPLMENDIIAIEVHLNGKAHTVYHSSIRLENLRRNIRSLFTNSSLTHLVDSVTQKMLDGMWEESNNLKAGAEIVNMLIKSQELLLEKTLADTRFEQAQYKVTFSSADFEKYTYQAFINNRLLAEIVNGNALSPSNRNGLNWQFPVTSSANDTLSIQVNLHGYLFTIATDSTLESQLRSRINALYLDKERGQLNSNVTQVILDELAKEVQENLLPVIARDRLLADLYDVQQILLENTFTTVSASGSRVVVTFRNEDFRLYRYVVCYSGGYISEIAQGRAFYSSLSGRNWSTTVTAQQLSSMRIEVRRT